MKEQTLWSPDSENSPLSMSKYLVLSFYSSVLILDESYKVNEELPRITTEYRLLFYMLNSCLTFLKYWKRGINLLNLFRSVFSMRSLIFY